MRNLGGVASGCRGCNLVTVRYGEPCFWASCGLAWHLPDFLTSAQKGGPGTGFYPFYSGLPVFFLEVVALAIIFTWVFNNTKGSIFIAILLHASYNAFGVVQPLFSAPSVTSTDLPFLISTGVPASLILILSRGQLGYKPGQGPNLASEVCRDVITISQQLMGYPFALRSSRKR